MPIWWPQIFRGYNAATTRHTPQGAAKREHAGNVLMAYQSGQIMAYQNNVRMIYGRAP